MCCRYLFDDSTLEDIWKVVNDVDKKIHWPSGDVHPADHALVIIKDSSELLFSESSLSGSPFSGLPFSGSPFSGLPFSESNTGRSFPQNLTVKEMKWGLEFPYSKQLIINARCETALSKASFSQGVSKSRCLIPAKQFYEWDPDKNKVTFSLEKENTMYMAGFYLPYHDINRFTILTTAANHSMKPVHDRMPLILAQDQIQDWIYDDEKVAWYLNQSSPELHRFQEFQQLSFFDLLT